MTLTRTVPFLPPAGSAVDPLVGEISWRAWELVGADPYQLTEGTAQQITVGFDCLVEAAWQPGRSVVVSEVEYLPGSNGTTTAVRLAVGLLGGIGETSEEAEGLAAHVEAMFGRQSVLAAASIDPGTVVPSSDGIPAAAETLARGTVAHIRQRHWRLSDDTDDVEVVSRFCPTFEPWTSVAAHLQELDQHVRVRATVLATEMSPADRIEIDGGLDRVVAIRERNERRPQVCFDADRAEATLLDLRASLSSPVVVGELAIWSMSALPDSTLRSLASSFTSETDVLRQQGHVVVAGNRRVLGGYEVARDPSGAAAALAAGLPLRGGTGQRAITDLLTLAESPIGWPLPVNGGVPSISTHIPTERRSPARLVGPDPERAPALGVDAAGQQIGLPLDLRTRHVLVTGTWGAGKSTVLRGQALADLRSGRPFLFLDPHGTAADELIAFADELGVRPVVIDAGDGATTRLAPLPPFDPFNRAGTDRAVRELAEAIASSLPNEEWAGPRWFAAITALLEVVLVKKAELIDGMTWLNDPTQLGCHLADEDISAAARATLMNLIASSSGDSSEVRGWVASKLNPLVGGSVRQILAPAGNGTDLRAEALGGRPVIVSLASLSQAEGNLVGHLVLSQILDAAFSRPVHERDLLTCYVDEAHRFPTSGLSRAVTEGRKFGIGLMLALQSLGQVRGGLDDLVLGAGTHVVLRSTPQSAATLAPVVQASPAELARQPDLHAVVGVQGEAAASVSLPPPETCRTPRSVIPPVATPAEGVGDTENPERKAMVDARLAEARLPPVEVQERDPSHPRSA